MQEVFAVFKIPHELHTSCLHLLITTQSANLEYVIQFLCVWNQFNDFLKSTVSRTLMISNCMDLRVYFWEGKQRNAYNVHDREFHIRWVYIGVRPSKIFDGQSNAKVFKVSFFISVACINIEDSNNFSSPYFHSHSCPQFTNISWFISMFTNWLVLTLVQFHASSVPPSLFSSLWYKNIFMIFIYVWKYILLRNF